RPELLVRRDRIKRARQSSDELGGLPARHAVDAMRLPPDIDHVVAVLAEAVALRIDPLPSAGRQHIGRHDSREHQIGGSAVVANNYHVSAVAVVCIPEDDPNSREARYRSVPDWLRIATGVWSTYV